MEESYEKGHFFHESLERIEEGITVFWTNERRHDTTKPLGGDYFRVIGIPTYLVRFQRLGVYESPNYEAIKFVDDATSHVRILLEGQVIYGRFLPIATSSEKDIARIVRDSWLSDLVKGINLDI